MDKRIRLLAEKLNDLSLGKGLNGEENQLDSLLDSTQSMEELEIQNKVLERALCELTPSQKRELLRPDPK